MNFTSERWQMQRKRASERINIETKRPDNGLKNFTQTDTNKKNDAEWI
jgi:hypothetical protein